MSHGFLEGYKVINYDESLGKVLEYQRYKMIGGCYHCQAK